MMKNNKKVRARALVAPGRLKTSGYDLRFVPGIKDKAETKSGRELKSHPDEKTLTGTT